MRFTLVAFEDEAVVFDAASGDTHYLAPLSLALLRILQESPLIDLPELERQLLSRYEPVPDMSLHTGIPEAVERLRGIGLLPVA